MRLVKTIKCGDNYVNVEVNLKVTTRHLVRDESYKEFNKVLDKIAKALFEIYNFQNIKLK